MWSFGVTLWEIFSDGEYPYCDIGEDEVVARRVRRGGGRGLRLVPPQGCPAAVMELMTACWAEDREARPMFGELKLRLQDLRVELTITAAAAAVTVAKVETSSASRPVSVGGNKKGKSVVNLIVIGDSSK